MSARMTRSLSWFRPYPLLNVQAVLEFPQACGITVGTPVRIRGVPVGSVMNVRPSLERVDVLVEGVCPESVPVIGP
eukprot:scaffold27457_cov45-Prasinocladus_malaysianus.AAC.1